MSIKQFNGNYQAQEDRILFRFNTAEDAEYRFWFTRRITLFILAASTHLIEKQLEKQHQKITAKALSNFEQTMVKEKADFNVQYEQASQFPLGADPVLISDVKCSVLTVDHVNVLSLDLIMPNRANINLKLASSTLRTMTLLLEKLAAQAQWNGTPHFGDITQPTQANPLPSTSAEDGVEQNLDITQSLQGDKKKLH